MRCVINNNSYLEMYVCEREEVKLVVRLGFFDYNLYKRKADRRLDLFPSLFEIISLILNPKSQSLRLGLDFNHIIAYASSSQGKETSLK